MADLDAFAAELRDVLHADAASVVPPPVAAVLARGRRRQRRRTGGLVVGIAAVLLAVGVLPGIDGRRAPERLAGPASTLVLDEGSDADGAWRLEWRPQDRCLTEVRPTGEGGACGLAEPPDLHESVLRVVRDGGSPQTLVAGLAPEGTTAVTVAPSSGVPEVRVPVVRSDDATLFVARLPGVTGVVSIVARGDDGRVVASFDGPAMPPLAPAPPAAAPDRQWVQAPWAVQSISEDRRSVTVRVYGIAAGCTGPGRGRVQEEPTGLRLVVELDVPANAPPCFASLPMVPVTVELPRPLAAGEQVLGECVADDGTTEGQQCREVRRFASLPPPAG